MVFDELVTHVQRLAPTAQAAKPEAGDPYVVIPAAQVVVVLTALKTDAATGLDSLMCLSGVDTGKELWMVYHLHSLKHNHRLTVKVVLTREQASVPSVQGLWAGAEFMEREAYELYNIRFENHPDLRRLLTPQDWVGFPGRKDYVFPESYQGVPLARENQFFVEDVVRDNAARLKQAAEGAKP